MNKFIIAMLLMFVLAGCETAPDKRTYVQPIVLHPPKPTAADIRDIRWKIWNLERIEKLVIDVEQEDIPACVVDFLLREEREANPFFAVWVLDAHQYQNFILDVAEIKRYLEQQNIIIQYYRDTFPSAKTAVTEDK